MILDSTSSLLDGRVFLFLNLRLSSLRPLRVIGLKLTGYYPSFSLLAQRKRSKRKSTRAIWSFGLRCAPESCRDFKNSLRSDSLKSFIGIFCGAHQMPMGINIAKMFPMKLSFACVCLLLPWYYCKSFPRRRESRSQSQQTKFLPAREWPDKKHFPELPLVRYFFGLLV